MLSKAIRGLWKLVDLFSLAFKVREAKCFSRFVHSLSSFETYLQKNAVINFVS